MAISPREVSARAADASTGLGGELGNTEQSCPKVTLELGIFFDGTLNNEYNTLSGKHDDTSYTNARSNVSLLKDLYKNRVEYDLRNSCGGYSRRYRSRYVEGIGSASGERDDVPGKAFGMGSTGIESRVYQTCLWVGDIIREVSPGVEPTEIIMDVFGFSRGAAAARYFVNCFRQGYIDYDKNFINRKRAHVPEGRKVRFRFIGIFDTVAAVGWADNDDNGPVNVHLKTDQGEKIFHITAENEFRINFRLNHNIPGGGETRSLPGAHSDIGGGYRDQGDTTAVGPYQLKRYQTLADAQKGREELLRTFGPQSSSADQTRWQSDGWYSANDPRETLRMEVAEPFPMGMGGYGVGYYQVLDRPWVQPGMARIALKIMYDKAMAQNVPFVGMPATEEYTIPQGLKPMGDTLVAGGAASQAQKHEALRNYGHVSSSEWRLGMGAEADHRRVIYPNQPGLAK